MAGEPMATVLRSVQRHCAPAAKDLTDGQLLGAFSALGDEVAFEVLIQRHGRLVLRVCRTLLLHEQDAEDAFQATFLVLAGKAASIAKRSEIAGWLHKTACHCAMQVKRAAARRRAHERHASDMAPPRPFDEVALRDLQAVLDEELAGLGERYRAAFVLCCLEGKSKAEAAKELGWTEGTVSGTLARARQQLQRRLSRRGVTLSAALGALALSQTTVAAVPAALARTTAKAALLIAAGDATTRALVSTGIADLTRRVKNAMLASKFKTAVIVIVGSIVVGLGAVAFHHRTEASPRTDPEPASKTDGPAKADAAPKPKADGELPQGVWKVETAAANGIHLRREEETTQVWQIVGDKITIKYQDGATEEMTYRLDATKSPRAIDLVPGGADQGEAFPGIYALAVTGFGQGALPEANSLSLCFTRGKTAQDKVTPRPTTFEQGLEFSRDRGRRLFVLRRASEPPKGDGKAAPPAGGKDDGPAAKVPTDEERFKELVKEFDAGENHVARRDTYEKRVLELAEKNPKEPFAVDALLWTLKRGWQPNGGILLATAQPFGRSASKALEILARDHAEDKRAAAMAEFLLLAPVEADQFLRALVEKNSERGVQGRACLALASRALWQADEARLNSTLVRPADNDEERKRFERMRENFKVDEEHLNKKAELYFELVARKYGDVAHSDKLTLGDLAAGPLFELRHLRIGMTAPEIEGEDVAGKKLKLSDHRGKVVLLDFYWWGNAPSQAIHPFERSLMKTFEGRPFTILGINRDPDRKALARTREEEKITWPSWFDASGPAAGDWLDGANRPGPIAVRWNVRLWPTLYLLDHKGVIRDKSRGLKDMAPQVEKLVQEAAADAKRVPADPKARSLAPVLGPDAGGWRFAAVYTNATAADVDLPTLLKESSVVLDGKAYPRTVLKFGGRSNLHAGESWDFTIAAAEYLDRETATAEGRHTLTLKFGGQDFGPVEFVWGKPGK